MELPGRVPGLKWLTIAVAVYGVLWISLEGNLWQALLLATGIIVLLAGYLVQRFMAGRRYTLGLWLFICSVSGLFLGLGFAVLTLILMAVKTGLHGHGPEFSPEEITWVVGQIPLWGTIGLLAGAGLGALAAGFSGRSGPK